jgi:hypothetical protein
VIIPAAHSKYCIEYQKHYYKDRPQSMEYPEVATTSNTIKSNIIIADPNPNQTDFFAVLFCFVA